MEKGDIESGKLKGKLLLTKIEERFAFPISRWFWHIVVAAAVLTLTASLIVIIYGIIPTMKKTVERGKYPESIKVTANDLESCEKQSGENSSYVENSESEKVFASFSSLDTLIPSSKYSWDVRGYWEESYYYTREWVLTDAGITSPLRKLLSQVSADTTQQASIISELVEIVKVFPMEKRKWVLQKTLTWCNKKTDETRSILEALKTTAMKLGPQDMSQLYAVVTDFGRSNPKDGVSFTQSLNILLNSQNSSEYEGLFKIVKAHFLNQFSQRADILQEATSMYVTLPPEARTVSVKSLPCFYGLYVRKFIDRQTIVNEMDSKYESDQRLVEQEYNEKSERKSAIKWKATIVFGTAIAAVAFFSLMLVLLSIQRTLKDILVQGKKADNKE